MWLGAAHLVRWWWSHSVTRSCRWAPSDDGRVGSCPDPVAPEWQSSSIDLPMRAWLFDCEKCGDSVLCDTETAWYDEVGTHTPLACQAEADRVQCQELWDLR